MGKKQRSSASVRKPPSPASTPATLDSDTDLAQAFGLNPELLRQCLDVMNNLYRGNHEEALRLFKDAVSGNCDNALLHYGLGSVYLAMAKKVSDTDDSGAKLKQLGEAAESFRRAVELSPEAIDIARVFIETISDMAKDEKGCQEVVQECVRALSIESPILLIFVAQKVPFLPDSIENVKGFIRRRLDETKLKLALIRSNPAGSENVKQKIKNVERVQRTTVEWRDKLVTNVNMQETAKVIEEKLKVVKLLQQKLQLPASSIGDLQQTDVPSELALRGHKLVERKRSANAKKFSKELNRKLRAKDYWNSRMSVEEKRELFRVRIQKLRAYLESCKNPWSPEGGLLEAIGFACGYKTWKFWEFCCCGTTEMFADFELYIEHVKRHIVDLPPALQSVLPQEVDNKWVKEVEKDVWKPVDAHAALSSTELQLLNIAYRDSADERLNDWPSSDDTERMEVLQKIRLQFQKLIKFKCLAESHITKVKQDTMEMLQTSFTEEQLKNHGLDGTLLCLRFLETSQLEDVLKFLEELVEACTLPLQHFPEDTLSNELHCCPAFGNREAIILSDDFSCIRLDNRILREEVSPGSSQKAVGDEGELLDDTLVHSLFASPMLENCFTTWNSLRDVKKDIVVLVCESLHQVFKRNCVAKSWYPDGIEAFIEVERLFSDEIAKRDQGEEYVPPTPLPVLLEKRKQLAEKNREDCVAKVIATVLDEACPDITEVPDELMPEYMTNAEARMQQTVHEDKKKIFKEACLIDCMILGNLASVDQTLQKLEWLSGFDYQLVMLPLLKSFIRAELEALVNKDATKQAETAAESLLAEIAIDGEKTVDKGGDNFRKMQKKAKDKKKPKKQRKAKDFKASGGCVEHQASHQEIAEQVCSPHPYGRDFMSAAELKVLQDVELRVKLQLQMYQKIFKQVRDQQGQIEGRVKREQPVELNVKTGGIFAENGADCVPVTQSKPGGDEDADPLIGKIGNSEGPLSVLANSDEGTTGLSNLRSPEDGGLASDLQRGGKQEAFHTPRSFPLEEEESGTPPTNLEVNDMSGSNLFGTGLRNDFRASNCFLNVVIQSLWHIRQFRKYFTSRSASGHEHTDDDTCVVCKLRNIFTSLGMQNKAVDPTPLRKALGNLYLDKNLFQEEQMNDASELLGAIFKCLHESFASDSDISDPKSEESSCLGSWDCVSSSCSVHKLFGMDIFQHVNCVHCSTKSRCQKYTSFFHFIIAETLRTMKRIDNCMYRSSTFEKLLMLLLESDFANCDPEAKGCGELNYVQYTLSAPPPVFISVLVWQSGQESVDDISETVNILDTEIDIGVVYRRLHVEKKYHLVSVVCYTKQHYLCFAYNHEVQSWIMFDDTSVEAIGHWNDVIEKCEKRLLQPQLLFFEAPQ